MEIQSKILSFPSLYEAADLLDPANLYEKQDELVAYCRSSGKPFLYKMPVRCLFDCGTCGIRTAEAHLHFEVPSRLSEELTSLHDPHSPSGYFYDIKFSTLHAILAHGKPMPKKLQKFFSRLRT